MDRRYSIKAMANALLFIVCRITGGKVSTRCGAICLLYFKRHSVETMLYLLVEIFVDQTNLGRIMV